MKRLSLFVCLLLFLASCGSNSSTPSDTPPADEPPKPAVVAFEQLKDSALDGQLVSIEGYLRIPSSVFYMDRIGLYLYPRSYQRTGWYLDARFVVGEGPNTMRELPTNYRESDMALITAGGDTLRSGDRVRLVGRIGFNDPGEYTLKPNVSLNVDSIYAASTPHYDYTQSRAPQLTAQMAADTTQTDYLVVTEGTLEVPNWIMSYREVSLIMKNDAGDLVVSFLPGQGPNRIDSIPSNFRDEDIKLYDHKGDRIDLRKPVRVYGSYSPSHSLKQVTAERLEQL